jgi:7,8-dihydropterin-6-yl-methyl-4-(beta-D-ribofuranosyl)aminobenzene 5'-phosphate synthase
MQLKQADKVEILTLQDNYIDLVEAPANAMVTRALPVKDGYIKNSVVAEHGFSALVKITGDSQERSVLFDFGFSSWGVAHNMDALGVDPSTIEVLVLSHGHMDHIGGLTEVAKRLRTPIDLVLHPRALDTERYLKFSEDFKIRFPELKRTEIEQAGIRVVESVGARELLGGYALFLGSVPRETEFEPGMPLAHYTDATGEHADTIEDDSSLVFALKDKGLVILTGCAHAGVINTIRYARKLTGVEKVHAVMGGFHLGGPAGQAAIAPTLASLKELEPEYVVPCHCTGRTAILAMEQALPGFILNMAGTKLTFAGA